MREVERLLDIKGDAQEARKAMISGIAAWAIDHPGQKSRQERPADFLAGSGTDFSDKRVDIAKQARDIVVLVRDEAQVSRRAQERRSRGHRAARFALRVLRQLRDRHGEHAGRKRYSDLIVHDLAHRGGTRLAFPDPPFSAADERLRRRPHHARPHAARRWPRCSSAERSSGRSGASSRRRGRHDRAGGPARRRS